MLGTVEVTLNGRRTTSCSERRGQVQADMYMDSRRHIREMTNELRQEAHELGEMVPDELNQTRMNMQMADVLGVTVDDLAGLSRSEVEILFEQGYPEFEKRQMATDFMLQSRTEQYDLGLDTTQGGMGEILTPVIGMQLDGKIDVNDDGSWGMPNYEMFDEADHLFYAAWMLRADLDNADFPRESLDEERPEPVTYFVPGTETVNPAYATAGEYIVTGQTVFDSYFDVGPQGAYPNPDFHAALESLGLTGGAQMRALSGMVADLVNKTPSTTDMTTAQTWFRVLALGRG